MTSSSISIEHVYPYLRLRGCSDAIIFYKQAFAAKEIFRLSEPSGRIGHAEIQIGETVLMLSDEYPETGIQGPQALGGTTVALHLHVRNIDQLVQQAVNAGATVVRPLANQFYGERTGMLRDPFGHEWLLGEQIEVVSQEEMQKRYSELMRDQAPQAKKDE